MASAARGICWPVAPGTARPSRRFHADAPRIRRSRFPETRRAACAVQFVSRSVSINDRIVDRQGARLVVFRGAGAVPPTALSRSSRRRSGVVIDGRDVAAVGSPRLALEGVALGQGRRSPSDAPLRSAHVELDAVNHAPSNPSSHLASRPVAASQSRLTCLGCICRICGDLGLGEITVVA